MSADSESLIQTDESKKTERVFAELSFGGIVATGPCAFLILVFSAVVISEAEDRRVYDAAVYNLMIAILTILVVIAVKVKASKKLQWSRFNIALVALLWLLWFIALVVLTHNLRITSYPFGDPEKTRSGKPDPQDTYDADEAAYQACIATSTNGDTKKCRRDVEILSRALPGAGKAVDGSVKDFATLAGTAWACVAFDAIEL
ncbi:hypothetical protein GLAREA_09506 [Glarea lozoyensis ATCC 20868]|uniref:Uncharacterized protein n=1 Tax=Glarea lozoyensis (strain ATCC 20868 / MF5171) TaxID=1116229 RepID=S3D8R2_GLAL2|nr:uncharacterized protein GLAREA_09506 [Glarea lozoyensis ATCC 20868]EPE28386.1 hypothetical protein GLAREA_09506 [Glarea lozoyensis ATCC 20868]